jgi:hypothetical protein
MKIASLIEPLYLSCRIDQTGMTWPIQPNKQLYVNQIIMIILIQ